LASPETRFCRAQYKLHVSSISTLKKEAERSFISAKLYGVKFQKIFAQNSSKNGGM